MNSKTIKLLLASVMGVGFLSVSQFAFADWDSGACPDPNTGPAPCIEHQDSTGTWWHFNGSGGHAGINNWHGYPVNEDGQSPEQDFEFSGTTDLVCEAGAFTCELTLFGEVKKFQDDDDNWRIGVRVNDGDVTIGGGDDECENITVGGFPWYAGHDPDQNPGFPGQHVLSNSTGIVYTGGQSYYTGHIGQIDVSYSIFGFPIQLVDGGHLHDVEYHNSGSSFRFGSAGVWNMDNILYEDGDADTDSGCTVDGTLSLQPPALDLNIL